jgi:hypothetical protein
MHVLSESGRSCPIATLPGQSGVLTTRLKTSAAFFFLKHLEPYLLRLFAILRSRESARSALCDPSIPLANYVDNREMPEFTKQLVEVGKFCLVFHVCNSGACTASPQFFLPADKGTVRM